MLDHGFNPGPLDGALGPQTLTALEELLERLIERNIQIGRTPLAFYLIGSERSPNLDVSARLDLLDSELLGDYPVSTVTIGQAPIPVVHEFSQNMNWRILEISFLQQQGPSGSFRPSRRFAGPGQFPL